jgi:hypothetical protein
MSELENLDNDFSMSQNRMWLFPDMLGEQKVKGFFTGHQLVKTGPDGKEYKKPMLILDVEFHKELENNDFPYKEFKVSYWTLNSKARDLKPSELIKTVEFEFSKDNQKINIVANDEKPYVEEVDLSK